MATLAAMLGATLPDSLDPDTLQKVFIGAIVVIGFIVVFVIRTVQKATTRVLTVLLLVAFGFSLWLQRENLEDCQGQCTCRIYGQTVNVPDVGSINCPND